MGVTYLGQSMQSKYIWWEGLEELSIIIIKVLVFISVVYHTYTLPYWLHWSKIIEM